MHIIIILILLIVTPSYAQDIPQDTINKRIQQLEVEKLKLEEIYKELMVRIDELKQLLNPEQERPELKNAQ